MLCPSVFQQSPFTMRPLLDRTWPVRSLWPETRPLLHLVEQEVMRHLLEMKQSMEHMERLHQRIFEELDRTCSQSWSQTWSQRGPFQPITVQELGSVGGGFALSLDTEAFSPEELSVKQVGRKLRVSGRTESKQEDASSTCSSSSTSSTPTSSSSSFRCEEFRQEFQLPDGVDHEAVTCSLVGGRLQILAPPRERALHDGKERLVPISLTAAPAITSSTSTSLSESSPAEKN
ncbi:heat shock protein beta-11-like [Anoplopoma fimbria]|uniref:heat shock protein beta-11-like n=1 Tax=Anoplopoma fimbria TaxID=229290 RepID=UPI0023EAFBA8|nr:heat shock protein beta-11-like [Anoplopoma fimbria]